MKLLCPFLVLSGFLWISSCPVHRTDIDRAATATASEHAGHTGVTLDSATDLSLYQLSSEWTDQHGRKRDLRSLHGELQVMAMVYTHCGYACPRIVHSMKRIEAAVPEANFVLVSIDPARDTPGRLLEFATGSRLDSARWTLLNGDDQALLELAAALGIRYRQTENGEFMHSNVLTVLDSRGVIVHRQEGFESDSTIAALRRLTSNTTHNH